jgi:hypothetical protein
MLPSQFAAEIAEHPQYKIKQELKQREKEKEALDYAKEVMVCDTCKWLSGEENNFLCHIISSETDAPYSHLKILNPKNFGCTKWEPKP